MVVRCTRLISVGLVIGLWATVAFAQEGPLSALQTRAAQGDAEAQFMLGSFYAAGTVLDQDAVAAAQWFLRSAEQGYARSFLPLGRAYLNGQGVTQDYVSAHLWFNIAAARLSGEDQAVAVAERDRVEAQIIGDQLGEAQRLARQWVATPEPTSFSISASTAIFPVGATATVTATESYSDGTSTEITPTWTSSDETVATVSASGAVTGVAVGTTTITGTAGGQSGSVAITVTEATVTSLTISASPATFPVGATATVTAVASWSDGASTAITPTWTSSDETVATVGFSSSIGAGAVTGVAVGTTTITGRARGGSGSVAITVTEATMTRLIISASTATFPVEATATVTAIAFWSDGTSTALQIPAWTSSDETVATVSASGAVTGVAVGTTTITGTAGKQSGSVAITVTADRVTPQPRSFPVSGVSLGADRRQAVVGVGLGQSGGLNTAGVGAVFAVFGGGSAGFTFGGGVSKPLDFPSSVFGLSLSGGPIWRFRGNSRVTPHVGLYGGLSYAKVGSATATAPVFGLKLPLLIRTGQKTSFMIEPELGVVWYDDEIRVGFGVNIGIAIDGGG